MPTSVMPKGVEHSTARQAPSPHEPVKEGAGWALGVWDDLYATAAVLMACPEDRPADFFSADCCEPTRDRTAIGAADRT